ncbi:MAG: outer membrane protein assembly factor BamE [Gammaproteobacteria bacterium]|nr:outer membrane protein assembly factor BamE [Gammaproteobacteria bacterium]
MNKTLAATMIVLPLTAALCVACTLPRVYRLSVQQGNVITQEMIDGLKPGMSREQVAYVMGQPVIRNPFDDSRWDYVYTLRVPGFVNETVKMSLFFTDDVLTHFTGDFKPSDAEDADADQADAGDSTVPDSAEPSSDPPVGS